MSPKGTSFIQYDYPEPGSITACVTWLSGLYIALSPWPHNVSPRRFADDCNVNKWLGFMSPRATWEDILFLSLLSSAVGRDWPMFAGCIFSQAVGVFLRSCVRVLQAVAVGRCRCMPDL